ncbi:hypothetical protein V8G54_031153 [Vigna mungo]|uniref:Uncharacterized protein n=1 Tax=Vigna mungo TaxID=3915 RepID=A0AAQ3MX19_VIGMU
MSPSFTIEDIMQIYSLSFILRKEAFIFCHIRLTSSLFPMFVCKLRREENAVRVFLEVLLSISFTVDPAFSRQALFMYKLVNVLYVTQSGSIFAFFNSSSTLSAVSTSFCEAQAVNHKLKVTTSGEVFSFNS